MCIVIAFTSIITALIVILDFKNDNLYFPLFIDWVRHVVYGRDTHWLEKQQEFRMYYIALFQNEKKSLSCCTHGGIGTTTIRHGVGSVVARPAAGPAPQATEKVDGVSNAPLPLTGNVQALLIVLAP